MVELKTLADTLVTTLGSMPPEEADRIVGVLFLRLCWIFLRLAHALDNPQQQRYIA